MYKFSKRGERTAIANSRDFVREVGGSDKQHTQKVSVSTMTSNKREVIDLLCDDDSVHSVVTSSAKLSTPQRKKRLPLLPMNGQNHRKTRTNDFDEGKESPKSCMRWLLNGEDCKSLFLFSQYKNNTVSFSSDTPMCHAYTPIVTDLVIQQSIFRNQVGQALDATDDIACLLSRFMRDFMFVQGEPNKNDKGVFHTPHNQSWSWSSCQLHTDSKFLFCSNLGPSRYDHPIAYNTPENRKLLANILLFVGWITIELGREKTHAFRMHCIRYTCRNRMGKHADYFGIILAKNGGYSLCLCISIGEPREISFSADLVKKGQQDQEGRVYSGIGFKITTRCGVDAYMMRSFGNGGCFLCFTDNKMDLAVQAQHSVKKLVKLGQ
jgi:hypothetical protein